MLRGTMALVASNRDIDTGRKLKKSKNKNARKWKVKAKYAPKKRTGEKEERRARMIFMVAV